MNGVINTEMQPHFYENQSLVTFWTDISSDYNINGPNRILLIITAMV